jgi:hypothetical protein
MKMTTSSRANTNIRHFFKDLQQPYQATSGQMSYIFECYHAYTIWEGIFTNGAKIHGFKFFCIENNLLTILSSFYSSPFSSRLFNAKIYFSLKEDLYCHVETTSRKTR